MRVGERRINYGAPGEGGSATEGGTEAWHRGREGPRQAVCAVGMKSEERGMQGRTEGGSTAWCTRSLVRHGDRSHNNYGIFFISQKIKEVRLILEQKTK